MDAAQTLPDPASVPMPGMFEVSPILASELACGLSRPSDVFARHGYTPEQAALLLRNPVFQSMLKQAKAEWDAEHNVDERIRIKSKLALEELLHSHYVMARSTDTPPPARTEAIKTFERLSGLNTPEKETGTTSRFVVNINLGDRDEPPITINAPALAEEG